MGKQYKVKVWDIKFYKVDEDGDALLNDDAHQSSSYCLSAMNTK
jgi:arginine decarboxylase-like protein